MKNRITEISNIELSDKFNSIIMEFEKQFFEKDKGIEKFLEYLGVAWIADINEVRGYELVPFEAELPFATGSDGEHMGWLNLCPEIEDFKKPFITWVPLGQHIFYHGINEIEILENSIKYLHGDSYIDIDLDFLKQIKINPLNGIGTELINYDNEILKKMPLEIPTNYRYEITVDGVGVITHKDFFNNRDNHLSRQLSLEKYVEIAKNNLEQGFLGTSLFYLKEAYFRNYYENEHLKILVEVLEMKKKVYEKLDRLPFALLTQTEINKISIR